MSPAKLKYIVHDGHVKAQDGDVHYISHQQVVRLYGVNPLECLLVNRPDWFRGYTPEFLETLKVLAPRQDGNWGWPSFYEELKQINDALSEDNAADVLRNTL